MFSVASYFACDAYDGKSVNSSYTGIAYENLYSP